LFAALVLFAGTASCVCQTTLQIQEPLPDPAKLLQAASDKEDAFADERQKYICVFTNHGFRIMNNKIKDWHRLYESFYIHGHEIERLLALNGVPLSVKQRKAEEARVTKKIEAFQRKPVEPFVGLAGGMSISRGEHRWAQTVEGAIIRAGIFSNERRVIYRGRIAIQIDFHGDKNFKAQTDEELIARGLSGTIIVDEESGAIVRIGADAPTDIYKNGELLLGNGIMFIGFDAVRIADNLYLPSSWVRNRYRYGEWDDFWLQGCREYKVEMRVLPQAAPVE
jgi:hypothetical protein